MTPKQIRKHLDLTQSDVAERLGISRKTVSKYENQTAPEWYKLAVQALKMKRR